jgi:hypothetical protein
VASAGARVGTSITCPASVTSASPPARPASATRMGSPIATTPPSVTRRTAAAAVRPIVSLWSTVVGAAFCPTARPTATCRSGGASSRAAATIASASPSRRSSGARSSPTDAYATLRPRPRPCCSAGVNGLVRQATCEAARTRAHRRLDRGPEPRRRHRARVDAVHQAAGSAGRYTDLALDDLARPIALCARKRRVAARAQPAAWPAARTPARPPCTEGAERDGGPAIIRRAHREEAVDHPRRSPGPAAARFTAVRGR